MGIDRVMPKGKWKFDEEVASVFENMLERSIPQYDIMRDIVLQIGSKQLLSNGFVSKHFPKKILDLGCSNGITLEHFIKKFDDNLTYTGIDNSTPMCEQAIARVNKYNAGVSVDIYNGDICKYMNSGLKPFDLILSILTIQFISIEHRQLLIQNIYDKLVDNGCFIFVEKVLGNNSCLNSLFVDVYTDMKRDSGYTDEQIERKKLSLEGVLVPMTSNWNKDMLKQAGFKKIDTFWRCVNFEGIICVK